MIEAPDGGSLETDAGFDDAGAVLPWGLLAGAVSQCGEVPRPVVPPWEQSGSWFVFDSAPASCDQLLQYEETLLCTADRLKEISDAVGTIEWKDTGTALLEPLPPLPWKIPPQASKDRFIARDLAIYVLAHLARLDSTMVYNTLGDVADKTCSRYYADALTDPEGARVRSMLIFGQDAFAMPTPPPTYPPTDRTLESWNIDPIANERLAFEAHVLRSAGRMLHDLVRESVYADLAGVERRRARAMDPLLANGIAWGSKDAENGPYNSLAHAAKILTGRIELGARLPDPFCGGAKALDALQWVYGPEREAREQDVPIRTPSQAAAVALVAGSGIVLDPNTVATASGGDLGTFVKLQLKESFAVRNFGVPGEPLGEVGQAFDASVDRLPGEDLRYAFQRNNRSYALATGTGPSWWPSDHPAISQAPYRSPALPSSTSVAQGGLDRGRLARDAMARVAGLLENAQCNEASGEPMALRADHPVPGSPEDWPTGSLGAPEHYKRETFQDVFSLGQTLQRRLTVLAAELDERFDPAWGWSTEAQKIARQGKAELQSWAGPGRVYASSNDDWTLQSPTHLRLRLAGFRDQDLGFDVTDVTAYTDNLVLVHGPSWVAECAARIRPDCPSDFETKYVLHPASSSVVYHDAAKAKEIGYDGAFATVEFSFAAKPEVFYPYYTSGWTPYEHLYLVSKKDPHRPGVHGVVLATLSLRGGAPLSTSTPVSAMQRELLNAVFGAHPGKDQAPKVGDATASLGPDYCIDGVPRDLFVPLENELTSDGDQYESSWKHYLTLAKQAAERTDALGEKLLQIGEKREFRREAAGEDLAEVCGDVTALESVSVDAHGDIVTKGDDAALSACLHEKKTDIVFLSKAPPAITTPAERDQYARTKLGCPGAHPLCSKPAGTISVGFLGLVDAPQPPPPGDLCGRVLDAASSLRAQFRAASFRDALTEPWADPGRLTAAASGMSLQVRTDGEWSVSAGGMGLMSSATDTKLWPGCLRSDSAETGCDWTRPEIVALNNLFRNCAPKQKGDGDTKSKSPGLGTCGDVGTGSDSELKELALLRWRVEGALWVLGGSTGKVPAGMFSVPVPVADNSTGHWTTGQTPFPLTQYNPDRRVTGGLLDETGLKPGDRVMMGPITDMATRFSALPPLGSTTDPTVEMSQALGWVFSSPNHYKLAFASNVELKTSLVTTQGFLAATKLAAGDVRDIWTGISTGLENMSCSAPERGPGFANLFGPARLPGQWAENLSVGAVASLKVNVFTRLVQSAPESAIWHRGIGYNGSSFAGWIRWQGDKGEEGRWDDLTPSGTLACRVNPIQGPAFHTPTTYSPSERVPLYVNSAAPCTQCGAAATLVQAAGLGCLAGSYTGGAPTEAPPAITDEAQLMVLEAWVRQQASAMNQQLSELYLEQLPERLVADYAAGKVTGGKKGLHGGKLADMAVNLEGVRDGWRAAARAVQQAADSIEGASTTAPDSRGTRVSVRPGVRSMA